MRRIKRGKEKWKGREIEKERKIDREKGGKEIGLVGSHGKP